LTPVADPYDYGMEGSDSPDAQALVILIDAVYRDWAAMANAMLGTDKSKSGPIRVSVGGVGVGGVRWVLGLLFCIGSSCFD
jgi:hypothetical protein